MLASHYEQLHILHGNGQSGIYCKDTYGDLADIELYERTKEPMQRTTDVVIIGGGVTGCAIAYYLSKSGIDVVLLEREEIGSQASGAAAGLLAPLGPLSGPGPFADLLLTSFALFPSLVQELEEMSGLRVDYEQTGALRTVRNPKRVAHLAKRMDAWKPLGLHMECLTGQEACQKEPLLADDICAAIYAPEEAQINAPRLVQAFSQAASKLGTKIYPHTMAIGIQKVGANVTSVNISPDETIACNYLILATGAWSAHYESWFSITLPVSPLRGQMIALQQPSQPLQHIIFGDAIYLAPKGSSIVVGATKEDVGFDVRVTEEGTSWLYNTAIKLVPILKECTIQASWAGLRPRTPDRHPILGKAPGWDNVILATGHNSVGILLSAITGKTILELVMTGNTPEIIRPFTPVRFDSDTTIL